LAAEHFSDPIAPAYNSGIGAITLLTDEEYLNMPDEPGKHELLDGELISMPAADYFHSNTGLRFQNLLRTVLQWIRVRMAEGYRLKTRLADPRCQCHVARSTRIALAAGRADDRDRNRLAG
jgi:Putative restriction endonuclease